MYIFSRSCSLDFIYWDTVELTRLPRHLALCFFATTGTIMKIMFSSYQNERDQRVLTNNRDEPTSRLA